MKVIKFIMGIVLGIIVFFGIHTFKGEFSKKTKEMTNSFPTSNKCKLPQKITFSFNSEFYITKEIASYYNNNTDTLINHHLKFLKGYFHFLENSYFYFLPTKMSYKNATDLIETNYPLEMNTETRDLFDKNYLPSVYQNEINISEKTPGYKIQYEADIQGVYCSDAIKNVDQIKFQLPVDPYLIYWQTPKHELSFNNEKAILAACISDRFVMEKKAEHIWYFWQPEKKAETYNCPELMDKLNLTKKYQISKIEHLKNTRKTQDFSFLHNRKKLKMTILYGFQQYHQANQEMKKIKNALEKHGFLSDELVLKQSKDLNSYFTEDIDITAKASLDLIFKIKERLVAVSSFKVTPHEKYLAIDLVGNTHADQLLNVQLVLSDSFSESESDFSKNVVDSLENSDFIIYLGHSNHGKNFNPKTFQEKLNLSVENLYEMTQAKDYQMIMNLSCFATAYHMNDFKTLRENKTTDYILAGSEGFIVFEPLAIIDMLVSKNNYLEVGKYLQPHDLVIIDRF